MQFDGRKAWGFRIHNGFQQVADKELTGARAIAVMSGKAVVPEPFSSTLFIIGGGVIVGRRLLRQKAHLMLKEN